MSTPYGTADEPPGAHIQLAPPLGVANATTPARGSQNRFALDPRDPRDGLLAEAADRPLMPLRQAFISGTKWRITTAELSRPGSTENSTKGGISHDYQRKSP